MNKEINILIIDDEKDICDQISGLLNDNDYNTRSAFNNEEALKLINENKPSLVILDIWLNNSKLDGFKTLEEIKKLHEDIPVIMISGHGNIDTAVKSIKKGAFDFIEKPFDSDLLLFKVRKALEDALLRRELAKYTNENLDFKFVHNSFSTKNLYELIQKIAKTESTILLKGPSGSGKEIIAKTIHNESNRSKKSFEILSCANLSPEDFENMLFSKKLNKENLAEGILERANGGTILLDQVEDMPLVSQGKIIRFLEKQKISSIGINQLNSFDIRIISSTKVDLTKLINKNRFREDLFFKINVVPINIPSLNERKEDIEELCSIFLDEYVKKNNLRHKIFTEDCINSFKSVFFPGNIRQLKNLVEWTVIMLSDNSDREISLNNLPNEIKLYLNNSSEKNMLSTEFSNHTLKKAKELFEKKYIEFQLLKHGNSITKVSKFIEMERTALYRKIKSLNINIPK